LTQDFDGAFAPALQAIVDAVETQEGKLAPKKRLVIAAAVECFAEFGYAATSTRMIAQRANVAEATIFRHFATKNDLLLRLVTPVARLILAPAVEEELKALTATSADFPSLLKSMMTSRLAFGDQYGPLVRIILQEFPVNPALREVMLAQLGGIVGPIVQHHFMQLATSHKIRAVEPHRLLRWVMSLLLGYYVTRTMINPGAQSGIATETGLGPEPGAKPGIATDTEIGTETSAATSAATSDWDDEAEIDAMVDAICFGVVG
jgi:AcrR family transcriptional regulator